MPTPLTDRQCAVIRGALTYRRQDILADPDFADDERAERLEAIDDAFAAVQQIQQSADCREESS